MKAFVSLILFMLLLPLQNEGEVEVYRIEEVTGIQVYAKNSFIYPVTIELELDIENLIPSKKLPHITVLPPNRNIKLISLGYDDKKKGWSLNSRYRHYMGNIFASHDDDFAYRLPYAKGESYRLDQGFGGAFSHSGDQQYALDLNMPENTRIYAARGGLVVRMDESYIEGGASRELIERANYITILHDDGTFADYSHLKYNGVEVEEGQKVSKGQLIGYSGATGFVTGPHLHFVVKKTKKGGGYISIPINFATKDGIRKLEEGKEYEAY